MFAILPTGYRYVKGIKNILLLHFVLQQKLRSAYMSIAGIDHFEYYVVFTALSLHVC